MRITGGKVFDLERGFVARDVCFTGPHITPHSSDNVVIDATDCYVIPGLTDIHFHGACGQDLSDADPDGLRVMAEYELSRGVTQICPAGMTLPTDRLEDVCRAAAAYRATVRSGAELVGINLEGPFLSRAKKGAQNEAWLREPDIALFHRLSEAAGSLIKLVSVAPELTGAMEFIRRISRDIVVSLAHTAATYATAAEAFQQGARHVTHLFNAMLPLHHREPGVIGAALDCPACRVELICDGIHIHPAVVRAVFRLFGPERVVLVSDSMRAAGLSDGCYWLGGQQVDVSGARATLLDGTLAGSVTDLMGCLRNAVAFGVPLADAVRAAAVNPAQTIGVFDHFGSLEPGKAANLVLLGPDLLLRSVFYRGKLI